MSHVDDHRSLGRCAVIIPVDLVNRGLWQGTLHRELTIRRGLPHGAYLIEAEVTQGNLVLYFEHESYGPFEEPAMIEVALGRWMGG